MCMICLPYGAKVFVRDDYPCLNLARVDFHRISVLYFVSKSVLNIAPIFITGCIKPFQHFNIGKKASKN